MTTLKKMAPIPPPANTPPKWRQDEMFPVEEYPSPAGVATYQPTRCPDQLSPDEVRTIRRSAKLKQDMDAVARAMGISSTACAQVARLMERAEVPSDFETPGLRAAREARISANMARKAKAAEKEEKSRMLARNGN